LTSDPSSRFGKWLRLATPATRLLGITVERELASWFEGQGFERVACSLRNPEQRVSSREIELERWAEAWVDIVTFNFDKYGLPRFQVHLMRRSSEFPHAVVRSGNLVRRPTHYLHFWGKPWWMPGSFWSQARSSRTVAAVRGRLQHALAFLETGVQANCISRAIMGH
jgi:hypothetical protein